MSFLTKITQLFSNNNSSQRIGIAFNQQGVALCSIPEQKKDKSDLNAKVSFYTEKSTSDKFSQAIQSLHTQSELAGTAHLVLSEGQSHVVQVDKPNVPDAEINGALKWQIKDLVSIAPDNMLLDYYDAPTLSGGKEKINVVCASLIELKALVAATEQNNLTIGSIITQEFAFANLLTPQNDAFLLVCQQPGEEIVLLIVKQQQLFFHRRLRGFANIGSKTAEELSYTIIDELSLEIQRSTDYFERQLKQAPIRGIKVLLPIELEDVVIRKLADNTVAPVSLLALPRPYHQHRDYAAAIGAVLDNGSHETEVSTGELDGD